MLSLSLMITYIRHRWYSTISKYFGSFYYIQIDPQDYDEWRTPPPEEEIHFSGPTDEDEHQNLSSDDNQVIQQETVCSEPPEPLLPHHDPLYPQRHLNHTSPLPTSRGD